MPYGPNAYLCPDVFPLLTSRPPSPSPVQKSLLAMEAEIRFLRSEEAKKVLDSEILRDAVIAALREAEVFCSLPSHPLTATLSHTWSLSQVEKDTSLQRETDKWKNRLEILRQEHSNQGAPVPFP